MCPVRQAWNGLSSWKIGTTASRWIATWHDWRGSRCVLRCYQDGGVGVVHVGLHTGEIHFRHVHFSCVHVQGNGAIGRQDGCAAGTRKSFLAEKTQSGLEVDIVVEALLMNGRLAARRGLSDRFVI